MKSFHLVDQPWVPVRYLDGQNDLASLDTVFRKSANIADLDGPPHERIALMRLLVCITQAALGAPDTPDDWEGFGGGLESRIPAYLRREDIFPHFNLFGEGPRFLQGEVDESVEPYLASQMVFHFATGNSPTLLDHEGGTERPFSEAFLARTILTYQNFFVGGSMASKIKGNGTSLKILHTFLKGKNLGQSVLLNCLDKETLLNAGIAFGRPVWEDKSQGANCAALLGRLVPFQCKLKLHPDSIHVWLEDGLSYPEFPAAREPSATILSKKDERFLLRADLSRGIWKDLHLVSQTRTTDAQPLSAPLTLQSHILGYEEDMVDLHLAELYKAKDAKIIDTVESFFTLPKALFTESGRARYEAGVLFAEARSNQLYGAIKQYGAALKNDSPPTDEAKKHFWHDLDQKSGTLLEIIREPARLAGLSFGEGSDPWTLAVRQAAQAAYDSVCPRQTPRQLQAYAAGLKVLNPKPKKKKSA